MWFILPVFLVGLASSGRVIFRDDFDPRHSDMISHARKEEENNNGGDDDFITATTIFSVSNEADSGLGAESDFGINDRMVENATADYGDSSDAIGGDSNSTIADNIDVTSGGDLPFENDDWENKLSGTSHGRSWSRPERPECAANSSFCAHAAHYPYAAVSKALAKNQLLVSTLRNFLPSSLDPIHLRTSEDRSEDMGAEEDELMSRGDLHEVNLCKTRREIVTPRAAKNVNGEYMWIVNVNKKQSEEQYTQLVTTTLCIGAEKPCGGADIFTAQTSTVCKQEYAEHKLLALDKEGKGLIIDSFRFPSCCTCNLVPGIEL